MKIGVTGSTGYIGEYMLRDYAHEHEFICPVRNINDIKIRYSAKYVQSDYSPESLKEIFDKCEAVIHLAARGIPGPTPKNIDPLEVSDYLPNVNITNSVFKACKDLGIRNIVYTSSKCVLGGVYDNECSNIFLREEYEANPIDGYGLSKYCGEILSHFYNNNYDLAIKCLRLPEVCGIRLSNQLIMPFWKNCLDSCVTGRNIILYGKGKSKREFIYVKDVVKALLIGIKRGKRGIYNISVGRLYTNKEIAEAFTGIKQNKIGITYQTDKEEWGTNNCLDITKARDEMGFEPQYILGELVRDIYSEYETILHSSSKGKKN